VCVLGSTFIGGPLFLSLGFLWGFSGPGLVTTSERRMSQTITWDCNTRDRRQGTGVPAPAPDSGGDRDRSPSQVSRPPDLGFVANLCARRWEIARSVDLQIGRSRDPKALSNVTVANDVIWICKWPERGRPDKQSVHKSSPRSPITDHWSPISDHRSVISEKREWSGECGVGWGYCSLMPWLMAS